MATEEPNGDDDGTRSRAVMALGVVVVLIVAGFFLVRYFHREGAVEDCLMAHRSNCDALTGG